MRYRENGFTAVELIVTIIVAMLLLGAAFQLYTTVLRSSATSQTRSVANNVSYDLLRQYQQSATTPCSQPSITPTIPSYADLSGASATVTITCPYGVGTSNISLVTVTVNYTDPNQKAVTRAIFTRN